jgi:phosphohistidine phosphatase
MRRLILFRHAKAEPRGAGTEDFDRPLTDRGRSDAALIGQVLAREGLVPDLALVSPAQRTSATWICARDAFPGVRAELRAELYDASALTIRSLIRQAEDRADTLIVVGHNPGLHEVAVALLIEAGASASEVKRVAARFPTATAVALDIDEAGRASLDGLFLAKEHGGEGEG